MILEGMKDCIIIIIITRQIEEIYFIGPVRFVAYPITVAQVYEQQNIGRK
jgi:hypothetical protein